MEQKWTASLNVAAASKEAQRWASEGQRKPTELNIAMFIAGVPQGWPEKKCRFAEALGCTETHPLWKCKAFGDSSIQKRGRIIQNNKMCPF
jgi:hypothetical protein